MTLAYYQPPTYTPVAPRSTPRARLAIALPLHMRARLEQKVPADMFCDLADIGENDPRPHRLCVDPSLVGRDPKLYGIVSRYAELGVPLVLYCMLTPEAIRDASLLISCGADRILLFDIDDSPTRLAALADDAMHTRITRDLMRALSPWLERLPLGLRETAEAVIDAPERFFDAEDVAARARISRRHVDRLFGAHGLAPAKHLVIACRAYVAVRLLATEASSINDAAELVGYDGQRGVRRHTESIWGLAPRGAARLSGAMLLSGIVEFVTKSQSGRA